MGQSDFRLYYSSHTRAARSPKSSDVIDKVIDTHNNSYTPLTRLREINVSSTVLSSSTSTSDITAQSYE